MPKRGAAVLLVIALIGSAWFSRGFTLLDTVLLLLCGLVAGGSLAALAAARQKAR